jgi:hypothetical protein
VESRLFTAHTAARSLSRRRAMWRGGGGGPVKDATNGSTWLSCCGRCRNEMKSLYDCPPIPSLIFSVGAMMPPKRMMALMLKKYSALYLSSVSSVCHPRAPSATTCRASTARGWRAAGLTQASRHLPTLVVDELDRASRGTDAPWEAAAAAQRGTVCCTSAPWTPPHPARPP